VRAPPTFLLVDPEHDDYLVSTNANELLDGSNTTSRKFTKKDHAIDVVIFQELKTTVSGASPGRGIELANLDISTHIGNLLDIHHDEGVNLRVLLLVKPAVC
jgi:hypothetical protein